MPFQRPVHKLPRYRHCTTDLYELNPAQEIVIRRLTPRGLSDQVTLTALQTLRRRAWLAYGFPDTDSLVDRLHHDLLFTASVAQPDGELIPIALLSGRFSTERAPRWSDLRVGGTDLRHVQSANFYEVLVAESHRGHGIGLQLLLRAAALCRALVPDIAIRTISPLCGLRLWLASLLGLTPQDMTLTSAQRSDWDAVSGLDASKLDVILAAAGELELLRSHIGVELDCWLRRICTNPALLTEQWEQAGDPLRVELQRLLTVLAQAYAGGTWRTSANRADARLACHISHFHLKQGGVWERYDAFARDDQDSLFMTVSYLYPGEPARQANATSFAAVRRGILVPEYPVVPLDDKRRLTDQVRLAPASLQAAL